jgi:hypothetical protein
MFLLSILLVYMVQVVTSKSSLILCFQKYKSKKERKIFILSTLFVCMGGEKGWGACNKWVIKIERGEKVVAKREPKKP